MLLDIITKLYIFYNLINVLFTNVSLKLMVNSFWPESVTVLCNIVRNSVLKTHSKRLS